MLSAQQGLGPHPTLLLVAELDSLSSIRDHLIPKSLKSVLTQLLSTCVDIKTCQKTVQEKRIAVATSEPEEGGGGIPHGGGIFGSTLG